MTVRLITVDENFDIPEAAFTALLDRLAPFIAAAVEDELDRRGVSAN